LDFIALDVETANADFGSICQVATATFRGGEVIDTWNSLIDPEDFFSPVNVSIHHIQPDEIAGAPTWKDIFPALAMRLRGNIVVCHTHFDSAALRKAASKYNLPPFECTWLDSARVVRRAWPQFARSGYGLTNVAKHFNIVYQAHDALEDARCAGIILTRAIEETGISAREWLDECLKPIKHIDYSRLDEAETVQSSEFMGEILVFTGSLKIPRSSAAKLARSVGFDVNDGVTRNTTVLVVGDQDITRLAGKTKSSKQIKAEALISAGFSIKIVGESDFLSMIAHPVMRSHDETRASACDLPVETAMA
jgi:DNA polymerase-3 subunit epsilon